MDHLLHTQSVYGVYIPTSISWRRTRTGWAVTRPRPIAGGKTASRNRHAQKQNNINKGFSVVRFWRACRSGNFHARNMAMRGMKKYFTRWVGVLYTFIVSSFHTVTTLSYTWYMYGIAAGHMISWSLQSRTTEVLFQRDTGFVYRIFHARKCMVEK